MPRMLRQNISIIWYPTILAPFFSDLWHNNLTGLQEFTKPGLIFTAHSRYIKWLLWCDKNFNHLVIITEMWTQLFLDSFRITLMCYLGEQTTLWTIFILQPAWKSHQIFSSLSNGDNENLQCDFKSWLSTVDSFLSLCHRFYNREKWRRRNMIYWVWNLGNIRIPIF